MRIDTRLIYFNVFISNIDNVYCIYILINYDNLFDLIYIYVKSEFERLNIKYQHNTFNK